MNEWKTKIHDIIDSHVHMSGIGTEESMLKILEATGIDKVTLVSIQDPETGEGLPQSLYMKARWPLRVFVFAGLNHAEKLSGGRVRAPGLVEQVESFVEMGCDGIKMIEGKPTSRQRMDIPVTDAYFADYWTRVEELGIPIIWHVNDPEEFWDPAQLPGWARERDWGYGPDDVLKEQLYDEVDAVLAKHPNLKVIFAHFYFLSADLARARRFLQEHPTVCFDLAPGIEMLYNLSHDPEASRAFFTEHADRILFGTDIFSNMTVEEACIRAGIIFRWLEGSDTFRVPEEADFVLGPPEDGIIRGMSLPDEALAKIYRDNFVRLAGSEPRPMSVDRAIVECERLGDIAEALTGKPATETEATKVARRLASAG